MMKDWFIYKALGRSKTRDEEQIQDDIKDHAQCKKAKN